VTVRMLSRYWMLALLFWPLLASAEDGCVEHFSEGDPALFRFLKTRATVDFSNYEGLTIGERQIVVLPIIAAHLFQSLPTWSQNPTRLTGMRRKLREKDVGEFLYRT